MNRTPVREWGDDYGKRSYYKCNIWRSEQIWIWNEMISKIIWYWLLGTMMYALAMIDTCDVIILTVIYSRANAIIVVIA